MNPAVIGIGIIAVIGILASLARASSTAPEPDTSNPSLPIVDEPDAPLPDAHPGVDQATQKDIEQERDRERTELPKSFPTPFSDVTNSAWSAYVNGQRGGKLNTVTPGFFLGIWLLGMRVLQDLGYARNVKLVDVNGKRVWKGDFVPPYSLERFLSDAPLQYEAFRRMTEKHANYIRTKYKDVITNKESKVSLSGLLAVAKQAGLAGMDQWLTDPKTRKEATTAQFNKFNGMF